ncbi:MAG: transcriptional repressor LexA [Desulfobacteraceae bacterium]
MTMSDDLTPRQRSVLDFIVAFQKEHRMAPTVREIGEHLGLSAPAGIHRLLNVLKDKGYILAEPGKKRSWRLARKISGSGIPLLGAVAAGVPIDAVENVEEELMVDPGLFGYKRCFGLRVRGDSMIGANIADGDIAIIRPQRQVNNGEIAAVLVEDLLTEATLKIVQLTKTALTLKAANPKYRSLVFRYSSRERVSIIGKYVGIVRRA